MKEKIGDQKKNIFQSKKQKKKHGKNVKNVKKVSMFATLESRNPQFKKSGSRLLVIERCFHVAFT